MADDFLMDGKKTGFIFPEYNTLNVALYGFSSLRFNGSISHVSIFGLFSNFDDFLHDLKKVGSP